MERKPNSAESETMNIKINNINSRLWSIELKKGEAKNLYWYQKNK